MITHTFARYGRRFRGILKVDARTIAVSTRTFLTPQAAVNEAWELLVLAHA